MGRLLAVELARKGLQVVIHDAGDRDAKYSAAYAAAAMLAPLAESAITEQNVVKMGLYSLPRWKDLIGELDTPVLCEQNGTLILWHRQDEPEAKRFTKLIHQNSQAMTDLAPAQLVNHDQITGLEPQIHNFQQGLFLPNEGQLDNRELLDALLIKAETLSVKFYWNSRKELSEFSDKNNWLIDCRGLGAKESWKNLRGVRGEVIRLHAPEVSITRPIRLIHPKYPIYIAPKRNHLFVIGATEIESDDTSNVSVRSTLELLSAAYTVHSGFAEARILEATAQCRPTLKNNLPFVEIEENIIKINGLYRHGFMISPAILDATVSWMMDESTDLFKQLEIDYSLSTYANTH